jgi:hypothetical protein
MTCAEATAISPVFQASRLHINHGFMNKLNGWLAVIVSPIGKQGEDERSPVCPILRSELGARE